MHPLLSFLSITVEAPRFGPNQPPTNRQEGRRHCGAPPCILLRHAMRSCSPLPHPFRSERSPSSVFRWGGPAARWSCCWLPPGGMVTAAAGRETSLRMGPLHPTATCNALLQPALPFRALFQGSFLGSGVVARGSCRWLPPGGMVTTPAGGETALRPAPLHQSAACNESSRLAAPSRGLGQAVSRGGGPDARGSCCWLPPGGMVTTPAGRDTVSSAGPMHPSSTCNMSSGTTAPPWWTGGGLLAEGGTAWGGSSRDVTV